MLIVIQSHHGTFDSLFLFIYINLDRNLSQIHRLRKNFESERKAHRSNIFKNIFNHEKPTEATVGKTILHRNNHGIEIHPKWGKNIIQKYEIKKKLP